MRNGRSGFIRSLSSLEHKPTFLPLHSLCMRANLRRIEAIQKEFLSSFDYGRLVDANCINAYRNRRKITLLATAFLFGLNSLVVL